MKKIFAINDTAVQAFAVPMFMRTHGEMIRSLQDEVNSDKKQSAIAAHPDDYELYELGDYEENTGKITPLDEPKMIARAKDLKTGA